MCDMMRSDKVSIQHGVIEADDMLAGFALAVVGTEISLLPPRGR